jgi:hypothetical protein
MATTYEAIATYTLPSAASSYEFASIPATYTDLVVVAALKSETSNARLKYRLNGDTGSNYSRLLISGNGTSAASFQSSNLTYGWLFASDYGANGGVSIGNFMNYSNTTTYKTMVGRTSDAGNQAVGIVSLWRSTAAINKITFDADGANWGTGSTFTLYGIKAA